MLSDNPTPRGILLLVAMLAAGTPASAQTRTATIHSVRVAEDLRPTTARALRPILDGLDSNHPDVRAVAVRALGRLESVQHLEAIESALADSSAVVRARAANAVEMAVRHEGYANAYQVITGRLSIEPDPSVSGALAYVLGSLRHPSPAAARRAADDLVRLADTAGPPAVVLGTARGLAALFRPNERDGASSPAVIDALRGLSHYRTAHGSDSAAALVRRLAVSALQRLTNSEPTIVQAWMADPDFQVRRLAVNAAAGLPEPHQRRLLEVALRDEHFSVRYESLRAMRGPPGRVCDSVRPLDPNSHVKLLAIDAMTECTWALAPLDSLAATLETGESWHVAAHALVGLARRGPDPASARLDTFSRHPVSFVRMYAARAAVVLGDADRLYAFAADDHHNVREVALRGLSELMGHEADSAYIANLAAADYQLVMTAAGLLEGTAHPRAAQALWEALARITAERQQTSRDARMAILSRLEEVARGETSQLESYLTDFDPAIAARAGQVLRDWTERPTQPSPQPIDPLPFPAPERLVELANSVVVLHMEDGGEIVISLRPDRAPTNAHRFARLVETGYFDGLTFHRVVPNFVIQGGSPGANEYAGDGPYTRDELTGDPHLRGTVGLSTRGRDTGDGQIFVNLVDNHRLDADYTLFGDVIAGMEVVDRVLEGAGIARAELRPLSRQ